MKKKKFLNKMVNLVDKALEKVGNLNEKITIYWNNEDMTMSFYHDDYDFAGTYTVACLYDSYNNSCEFDEKIKVKEHTLCQKFAEDVALDMKMFVREKENPIIVKTPLEKVVYIKSEDREDYNFGCEEKCEDCNHCIENDENKINPFDDDNEDCNCDNEESLSFPDVEKVNLEKINEIINVSKVVCPKCGSSNARKNGRKAGKQQWICKDCNRYFTGETVS